MRAHLQKAKGSGGPHGIGPNWRPAWLPKPLVYVYKSDVPCTDIRRGKDRFEDALAALFDRGFLRVDDPKDAELFYHPACLVDLFMTSRITGKANAFGRSALLYHAEQRIVRQIKALGYEDRPHIVNALRCYGVREERNPANHGGGWFEAKTRHDAATNALPTLWAQFPSGIPRIDGVRVIRRPFWRFCEEAVRKIDRRRSANFPYCAARAPAAGANATTAPPPPPPKPHRERSISVLFIGSSLVHRDPAIAALNNTPGARLVLLDGKRRRLHDASLTDLMRDANYTLCPTGDTPESERIYQALEAGSIPLLDHGIGQRDGFQAPAFANWSNFSAPIRFLSRGGDQDHFRERQDCPRATVRDPERRWAALRRCIGPLQLPSADEQRRLELGVREHAADFRMCEPDNMAFASYVHRSLRLFAAEAARQDAAGVWPIGNTTNKRPLYPASISPSELSFEEVL
jgi:hypothetical protein